ncbi:MAG: TldD/PmbA family protein [Candidatus Hodarchaeales archaeon]
MEDVLLKLLDFAQQSNISYADFRFVRDDYEILEAKNGAPLRLSESQRTGLGVRVLLNGAWGFASTNDLSENSLKKTVKLAIKIARVTSSVTRKHKGLCPEKAYQAKYKTPIKTDPFSLSYKEKMETLVLATKILSTEDSRIRSATASLLSRKYNTELLTSESTHIRQELIQCGASITGMLMGGPAGMTIRTAENYKAQGFEFLDEFDLEEQAITVGKDLKILIDKAEKPPSGKHNLILEPSHLGLVIHESVGHPTEMDRVLGREADFAGTSFLSPDDIEQKLQYGSEVMNIVHDPTIPPALGTYGFDDDGVRTHRVEVVKDGVFQAFQTDRSTAYEVGFGRSSGNARAHGHDRFPIDRMANLYFEPNPKLALSSFEELLQEAKNGVYALYSRTHSISPNRTNFQFTTQMGYLIVNGELTKPLKNVVYGARTLDFWNSCLATTKNVEIFGTPNCGKGNPGQTIWTSHGGGHTLFGNVRIGV